MRPIHQHLTNQIHKRFMKRGVHDFMKRGVHDLMSTYIFLGARERIKMALLKHPVTCFRFCNRKGFGGDLVVFWE